MNNIHSIIDVITNSSTEIFSAISTEAEDLIIKIITMATNMTEEQVKQKYSISIFADPEWLVERMEDKIVCKKYSDDHKIYDLFPKDFIKKCKEANYSDYNNIACEYLKSILDTDKEKYEKIIDFVKSGTEREYMPAQTALVIKNNETGEETDLTSLIYNSIYSDSQNNY
jgi:hypothetical protein